MDKESLEGGFIYMDFEADIVTLEPLYKFLDDKKDQDRKSLLTSEGNKAYRKLIKEFVKKIPPEPGLYCWGKYDAKGAWHNIYVGMTKKSVKPRNLRNRIYEELDKERCFLWRKYWDEKEIMKDGEECFKHQWRKYEYKWKRALEKAGSTHIMWACANTLGEDGRAKNFESPESLAESISDSIRKIENILIVNFKPSANRPRGLPQDIGHADTIAEIFSSKASTNSDKYTIKLK